MPANRIKYELREVEQLIRSVARTCGRSRPGYKIIENHIKAERERIRLALVSGIFDLQDERQLKRYIQYHQHALIHLMDESTAYNRVTGTAVRKVNQQCYQLLTDLLRFMEKQLGRYFDYNVKVPNAYRLRLNANMRAGTEVLQKELQARGAGVLTVQTILVALQRMTDEEQAITYHDLIFANELEQELSARLAGNRTTGTGMDENLRTLMIYLNYNSAQAFTCITRHIESRLKGLTTRPEKIEKLSYFLKWVNQAPVKIGIAYNRRALELKVQVKRYIQEEIEHLQRIRAWIPPVMEQHGPPTKIKLKVSVAQAAGLIRLLVETGVIVNDNVTELLRVMTRCIDSKKNETVSSVSLRNKYYNVEQGTREELKNRLQQMIRLIDKV